MRFLSVCILATCIASCLSIDCIVCDSYLSCNSETKEFCPDSLSCFTVFDRHVAIAKGCATNCKHVPAANHHGRSCKVCDYDGCNRENSLLMVDDEVTRMNSVLFRRKPRNLGARSAHIERNPDEIGSGASVRSSKNAHEIGSGVDVEESRAIGEGVVIDRHNDHSRSRIGEGASLSDVGASAHGIGSGASVSQHRIGSGASVSQHGIGSGASVSQHGIGSGASVSQPAIGRGVQIKKRSSIGHGVGPDHHRDHNKKHQHPPPLPSSPRRIGSGVDVGHRIGSGVSGHQSTKVHHKSKHHSYRKRRSDLDQLVRGVAPDSYRTRQQNPDFTIGGGVAPNHPYHNSQDGPGIGHGVSPRKSSPTLASFVYIPISFFIRRFIF